MLQINAPYVQKCWILRRIPESYWQNSKFSASCLPIPLCLSSAALENNDLSYSFKSLSGIFIGTIWGTLGIWEAPRYWSHLCILGECIDIGGWCWIDWRYFVKVFINVNSNSFSFTNSTLVNNHRNMEGGKVLFAHDLRTEVGTRVCSSWTLSLGNESVRQLERMRKFSGCLIP